MQKAAIQNLGCSKNQIDGERIEHFLQASGYTLTSDYNDADLIIVNTCAFIREAQEEAIDSILEMALLRKNGTCRKLIVSGCFSERFRDTVRAQFPEVDLWAGVNDWEQVLKSSLSIDSSASFRRVLGEPAATQYLKIAEGCSHQCTFCVIPSIRGGFKSRTPESIIEEAQWLESNGVKELILVAQDTSFYGRDIGITLDTVLKMLLDKTGFPWIRMMYLHPKYVTDALLDVIASQPRICPYFDIPLQHIADPVLKSMNRTPLSSGVYKMIEKIRTKIPEAGLRTSFIAGFPGETGNDFKELLRFMERVRFDKVGVFPFSPEEGTKAFTMKNRPSKDTTNGRCEELMLVQREISRELLESRIGRKTQIIIDRVAEDPDFNYEARSRIDAPEIDGKVLISSGDYAIGSIVEVTILGAGDYDQYA